MILAPLRGVTIRCFRETFAEEIRTAGFVEAITPFISAIAGFDPLRDRELSKSPSLIPHSPFLRLTPQFIGKDPEVLRTCLERVKRAGYDTADLNCGCPFPMVRNKGRGSGLLRTPDVLCQMLEVGCETMGPGKFSVKARLGIDRNDELLRMMPMINQFPLRFLTVHARTARQMYSGVIDAKGLERIRQIAKMPLVANGDIPFPSGASDLPVMIGRSFVRHLGTREDSGELLARYIVASRTELCGDRPVLGRMKELIGYWKDLPRWRRRWAAIKLCRSVDELKACLGLLRTAMCLVVALLLAGAAPAAEREEISLAGTWEFALDGGNVGLKGNWARRGFSDTIALPGTTDLAKKGDGKVAATERIHPQLAGLKAARTLTMHALRRHPFVGTAWYRRTVEFPAAWSNRVVGIVLERTKIATLFVDGVRIGTRHSLVAPQEFELPVKFRAGRHVVTLAVDNRIDALPVSGHQVSDDTQTNWNGVIGELKAVARDLVSVERVRITPHSATRTADVEIVLRNRSLAPATGVAEVSCSNGTVRAAFAGLMSGDRVRVEVAFPKDAALWDEFTPALHNLRITLHCADYLDVADVRFGFCEMRTDGGRFTVNGKPVFLRGRHDACVWPKTGCPPMDKATWLGYFRTLRAYGLNHVRAHTWCFPRAAFEAADETGFYLQGEFASFGGGEFRTSEPKRLYALAEARRQSDFYGNSPSFAMWTFANEPCGSAVTLGEMVSEIRAYDPRRLYAQASNGDYPASYGFRQNPGDDFRTTFRTTAGTEGNVRGSYSHCDLPLGRVQTGPADTLGDHSRALRHSSVPVIGHEAGQYQSYPDFDDIGRYDGVLRAANLEVFRSRVEKAGLLGLAPAFFRDSAALQAINYREEIEEALRTPRFGGFQLLDLQDFPGQGTALVGILNAFLEPKGAVTPERWRNWCAPTVLLARFARYVHRAGETFAAKVQCAHYGPEDCLAGEIVWRLEGPDGAVYREGRLPISVARGEVATAEGEVAFVWPPVAQAGRHVLRLEFAGRAERSDYGLWVYPPVDLGETDGVVTVRSPEEGRVLMKRGKKVLCILDRTAFPTNGVPGMFASDFWCYPMFRRICESAGRPVAPGTLGLSMDPGHPALKGFPTATHSDYQWFDIVMNSVSIPLEGMPGAPVPIVRTIDNVERNHTLALVYEQVDRTGRLVVCGSDLIALRGDPAADQLRASLLAYLGGRGMRNARR